MHVHTDEISILEIEAIQLVAGLLGIHDIFKHDESGTLGIVRDALTYLTGFQSVVSQTTVSESF